MHERDGRQFSAVIRFLDHPRDAQDREEFNATRRIRFDISASRRVTIERDNRCKSSL